MQENKRMKNFKEEKTDLSEFKICRIPCQTKDYTSTKALSTQEKQKKSS